MKTRFRFEKLEVWQEARKINQISYRLTRKFPREELFALTSQIRRASISSNIAEGSGGNSDKDFAHFLEHAYGSLREAASTFSLGFDQGYVKENDLDPLFEALARLAKRIVSLNRSLSVSTPKTPFSRVKSSALGSRPSTLD